MSPRTYKIENRRAAAEQTRSRVLEATRKLIMASSVPPSIDAVAALAGVARMTVYYQFGSKAGLLEALFDELGGRYFRSELPLVMSQDEPLQALADLIEVFLTFWASERLVTRRIRGMAALDSDFEESLRGRDKRRKPSPKCVTRGSATSETAGAFPKTWSIEVTPRSEMPQGTIRSNHARSTSTLSATPWVVTQPPLAPPSRLTRTPIAAIFSFPTQTPVSPHSSPLSIPKSRRVRMITSSRLRT